MKSLLIWLVSVFAISCSSQVGNTGAENGKEVLFYLSVRDDNYDIFKNDLEGNEVRLTTNPGYDYHPMWNQTLQKLIYYSYVNDSFLIASKDIDGKDVALDTYGNLEFNLSPDGKSLINQVQVGDTSILILIGLEHNKSDTIATAGSYNGRAKWSWESDRIAYISDREGNNEVYVYHIIDRMTTRLTENSTNEKYITWEPGGKRLAFTTQYYSEDQPNRNDVLIYEFTSKKIVQITFNDYNDEEISWSPKGDKIAFHSKRDNEDHIFIMNTDGSEIKQITSEIAYHGEPEWGVIPNK